MEIEVDFNFIYTMYYNGLMIFFTSFQLSTLLTSCILHLLKYIETHVTQCFVIILEWLMNFFIFFELSTFLHA